MNRSEIAASKPEARKTKRTDLKHLYSCHFPYFRKALLFMEFQGILKEYFTMNLTCLFLILISLANWSQPHEEVESLLMTGCDSTRTYLSLATDSPENNWLARNENNCSLINEFLRIVNYEESAKSYINEFITLSVNDSIIDLADAIEFYYQVFKPEAYNEPFDQLMWLAPVIDELANPRAKMIDDLLKNHITQGMTKAQILELLGPAEFDGIQDRLAAALPDSLDRCKTKTRTTEESKKRIKQFNEWMRTAPRQPDTLLIYPIGWGLMDPIFLEIILNGNGQVRGFSITQS